MIKDKTVRLKAIIIVLFIALNSIYFANTTKAIAADGELNSSIGADGYVEISDTLESWTRLLRLNDNQSSIIFGYRKNNPDERSCAGYASVPILKNIYDNGATANGAFGNNAISFFSEIENVRFNSAYQDSSNFVYISGNQSDVLQTNSGDSFSCSNPNSRNFVIKLNPDGSISNFGSDNIRYFDIGTITSINPFSEGILALTLMGNSDADVLFINSSDGSLATNIGDSGKIKLQNDSLRVHSAILTNEGLVLVGDILNETSDWILRWAITEISLDGVETERFKGSQNFQYSSGYKEGIYIKPIIKGEYIYIVGGVLTGSTYDIKAMRINQDGTLDNSYGGNLRSQLIGIDAEPCSYCSGEFSVDNYGRVLISIGTTQTYESGARKSVIVRLNKNGNIDNTFGDGGKISLNLESQAGIYPININDYLIYGNQYSQEYCSGSTCGLYKSQVAQFSQDVPPPVITSVSPLNGAVKIDLKLEQVLVPIGNWFYQIRSTGDGCSNPYGNDTTWDTNTLVSTFQIGRIVDNNSDGFDLTQPLTNGCTYTIRIAHWNSSTNGSDNLSTYIETTAIPGTPYVETRPATSITGTSATLNGIINGRELSTSVDFCIATTSNLSSCIQYIANSSPIENSSINVDVNYTATNLDRGTTYFYRVTGINSANTSTGSILSFTTLDFPSVNTLSATAIDGTSATINGSFNPKGASTTAAFCIGLSQNLTECSDLDLGNLNVSGSSDIAVNKRITNLKFDTYYYYKLTANNSVGTSSGSFFSFKTPSQSEYLNNLELIRKEKERKEAEEKAAIAEELRKTSVQILENFNSGSNLTLNTLKLAGVASAIPETYESLVSFIVSLDSNGRKDIALLESKAKDLKLNFYLNKANSNIDVVVLQNLGMTGVNERLIPELNKFISFNMPLDVTKLAALQREINKINTLLIGKDTGSLSLQQLQSLGIKFTLPSKSGQILLKFKGQSPEVFASSERIQLKITEIENVIRARLEKTQNGKARTLEILKKIQSRTSMK